MPTSSGVKWDSSQGSRYGKLFFLSPWREVLAMPCHGLWHKPTRTDGKIGWVSKESVYFANFNSCLRVRPSSHSAFSLALADPKNSQMAVGFWGSLRSGYQQPQHASYIRQLADPTSPVCSRAAIWPVLSCLLEASKATEVNSWLDAPSASGAKSMKQRCDS